MSFKRQRKSDNSELNKVRTIVNKVEKSSLNANIDSILFKKLKMKALIDNLKLYEAIEKAINLYINNNTEKG